MAGRCSPRLDFLSFNTSRPQTSFSGTPLSAEVSVVCLCGCFQVLLFAGMFSRVRGLCLGGPALPGARRLASGALSVIISSTSSLLPDTFLSTRAVGLTSQWAVPCSQVLAPWPVPSETRVCYRDLSRLQPTLLASGVSASESGPRGRHEVRGRLSGHTALSRGAASSRLPKAPVTLPGLARRP